ncbi:hypothetical protein LINPERPRIM_LOCUS5106, partial [Linum perenne]
MGEDGKSEIKVAGGSGGRSRLGGDDESGITVAGGVESHPHLLEHHYLTIPWASMYKQ